jgi:hypothetical protein
MPSRTFTEVSRPGLVTFDVQDPVLSFVVPDGVAARAVVGAMGSRLEEELRHGNGDVYGVAAEVVRLPGTGTLLVQLAAKSGPGAAGTVAEAMVRELEHRVRTGVSADELEEMLEWWDAADSDPDEVGDLEMEAERLLSGLPPLTFAEARAEAAALDPADVAAMMGGVSASTLLLVPRDVEPATSLPVGASCSTSETMTTAPLRRRFRSKAPRGVALGFDGELVELRDQDGDVHRVRLEDVVGVGVDGSARELVGRGGCFVTVDPRDFAGADAVVRAIDARVPAGLHFDLAAYFAGT